MKSYGLISSESYGVWFPEKEYEDTAFYRGYLQRGEGSALEAADPALQGEFSARAAALEVGCGDGRLLVPFVKEGFDVEGVDFF